MRRGNTIAGGFFSSLRADLSLIKKDMAKEVWDFVLALQMQTALCDTGA